MNPLVRPQGKQSECTNVADSVSADDVPSYPNYNAGVCFGQLVRVRKLPHDLPGQSPLLRKETKPARP